jgi:hypothetical protein
MQLLPRCLAAALACAAASAQNYTALPLDNPAGGTSQNIPWAGGTTNWDEARSQYLFPAPFLPGTGGVITGIDLVPASSNASFPYERFEIWMDHTTNATLSTTFASNLSATPTLVFSRTPGTITWTAGTWQTIQFDTPFVYDGNQSLVMEVRKKVDRPNNPTISPTVSQRILTWPRRVDLPPPIWAYGVYGSGAVDAALATTTYSTHFLMRLQWGSARTLTIDSTRDVTGNANRSYFHLGATATITAQGMPGEAFLTLLDAPLLPAGIPTPPVNGEFWFTRLVVVGVGALDGAGRGSLPLTIPGDQSLVGARVFFQALVAGATFDWTNVVDAPIAIY